MPRSPASSPAALADAVRARVPVVGLLVKMPAPATVEAAGLAGLDFVVIDCEHGPGDTVELEHHLRAADARSISALVRVSDVAPAEILRALDAGATGIIVPHVSSTAHAEAAVAAARYPPAGRRGFALSTRAACYGFAGTQEHLERASRDVLVLLQLEDAEVHGREQEILAVAGVDGVVLGLADLALSVGRPGDMEAVEVQQIVASVLAAGAAAGLTVMAVARDRAEADRWANRGATGALFVAQAVVAEALRALVVAAP